jgi:hypothetical protein
MLTTNEIEPATATGPPETQSNRAEADHPFAPPELPQQGQPNRKIDLQGIFYVKLI